MGRRCEPPANSAVAPCGGEDSIELCSFLAGARKCLFERGYLRTTARDIAAAAGVSLAAIGYHFGSKEALLNAAMMEATSEWGEQLDRVLQDEVAADTSPLERFEAVWTRVIDSLAAYRPLWAAQVEVLTQLDTAPELRAWLADAMERGRLGLAELIQHLDPVADPESARAVGGLYHAILSGLVVQWLTDPDRAPTGHELATGMRLVLSDMSPAAASSTSGSRRDT